MTEAAEVWTILRVLDWTRDWFERKGVPSPRLDAEVLLAHALGIPRVMLYARFDQPLKQGELEVIRALVQRRGRGEPVAYLVQEKEFWSLPLRVTPDVLIPRPDTEVLVEVALMLVKGQEAPRIVDVGTGSGAIAIALAKELPGAALTASDVSAGALSVAASNLERHGLVERIRLIEADLLSFPGEFELIVANLPYIRTEELPTLMAEVRSFEPHSALDGGLDGLDPIRRLIDQALAHLSPGGAIALEAAPPQLEIIRRDLEARGFIETGTRPDYAGQQRVAFGRKRI